MRGAGDGFPVFCCIVPARREKPAALRGLRACREAMAVIRPAGIPQLRSLLTGNQNYPTFV